MSYAPTSACGSGCLPRPGTVPRVGLPVRVGRVLGIAGVLVCGLGLALIVPVLGPTARARATRRWFRAVMAATGVRLEITGAAATSGPPDDRQAGMLSAGGPVLVAANHVSWLDIPALLAVEPMRVLAKADLRSWPVLGYLAARAGTLFIDRTRLRRLPATVGEIADALRGGQSVLVFPEGSTWCGRTRGRYRPATIQAAIDAGVPVRPLSLRYVLAHGTPTTVAAWVGTDTLLASVWRIAGVRGLTVRVELRPLVATTGGTRRRVAAAAAAFASARAAGSIAVTPGRQGRTGLKRSAHDTSCVSSVA